jgi:2-polyprenyl-6-methoxyphenol hydroxylase-like FAD-dependent oxidoreductase
MSQPDALQQATQRLDAAVDELEIFLGSVFVEGEEGEGGVSIATLKEQVRFLTEERDRLLVELDAEKSRVRRLMDANDEVSERLETVMGTLKEIMPAVPG